MQPVDGRCPVSTVSLYNPRWNGPWYQILVFNGYYRYHQWNSYPYQILVFNSYRDYDTKSVERFSLAVFNGYRTRF